MKKTATTRGAPRADPSCSQMPPPPPPKANAQVPKREVDGKQVIINISGLKDHKYAESVTRGWPSPEILSMLMNSPHANLILEAFQHATSVCATLSPLKCFNSINAALVQLTEDLVQNQAQ